MILDPQQPARLANAIGRPVGLACRYEWDGHKFRYRFFRHGYYIGVVNDPKRVIAKMERYVDAEARKCLR